MSTKKDSPYHCDCKNSIDIVNAKFRSFDADGNHFDEVHVRSGTTAHLKLAAATGNTIKIESWDVSWDPKGCFDNIADKDNIEIVGISDDFQVRVNSHTVDTVECPVPAD